MCTSLVPVEKPPIEKTHSNKNIVLKQEESLKQRLNHYKVAILTSHSLAGIDMSCVKVRC